MQIKPTTILLLMLSCHLIHAQNDTILRIFRSVFIQNDRKIALQSNVDKLADLTRKIDNTHYALKKGSFQVADSMAVEVNAEKQIISIIASYDYAPEYSSDTAYIHEQRKYNGMISKGKEFHYSASNKQIRVTKWAFENTIFELIELIVNGKKMTYSVIFDLDLNYKKYKNIIDLKRNDVSLELLKIEGLK